VSGKYNLESTVLTLLRNQQAFVHI